MRATKQHLCCEPYDYGTRNAALYTIFRVLSREANMKALILSALIGLSLSRSAYADLIEADYLVEGDNLAVYDTLTQKTWLDLTVTNGMSVNQFLLAQGEGMYAGWRMPSFEEVEALFFTYAVDDGVTEIALGQFHSMTGIAAPYGTELMAATFGTESANASPYGLVDLGTYYSVFGPSGQWGFHYGSGTYDADSNASNAGIFLVYDDSAIEADVNLSSFGLATLGLMLLGFRRNQYLSS